ncbi:MAG: outer membrane beta-barrel protein, partial [Flavobacterium sp.]
SFTYSKRINRPNFESLNPFKMVITPFQTVEGNPFLQPSYTNNYELIFNYKNNDLKFYISDSFSMIDQVANINSNTNITEFNYYNFLDILQIGITETYTYNKFSWWESSFVLSANYIKSKSSLEFTPKNLEGYNTYLSTDNNFILNKTKTFFANIGYYYQFASKNGVDSITAYGSLSGSLRLLLLNKTLSISASINDALSTERPTRTTFSNGIKQDYNNYWDNRQFRLSIKYNFGNQKISVKKNTSSNESEINRLGN